MDLNIKNRTALVMGASSGLGFAAAQALIQEGVRVIISARDTPRLAEAARKLGAHGFLAADLNLRDAGQKLVQDCTQKFGAPDILVTNAGGPPKGAFETLTPEMWMEGFQSLWLACTQSIVAALPHMKEKKWGRILLITSAAAREPMNHLTVSNGLRAGLLGLTKSVSNEVASFGITINSVLPGFTDTERLQELKIPKEKIVAQIPAGRIGRPEEFASLIAYLSSDLAGYVCGQSIAVDGGYLKGI
jgi:3-oxoacyl-[acyl-carrier protein] reductase